MLNLNKRFTNGVVEIKGKNSVRSVKVAGPGNWLRWLLVGQTKASHLASSNG